MGKTNLPKFHGGHFGFFLYKEWILTCFLLVQLSYLMSSICFGTIFMHFGAILMEIWENCDLPKFHGGHFGFLPIKPCSPTWIYLDFFLVILDTFLA